MTRLTAAFILLKVVFDLIFGLEPIVDFVPGLTSA
jgi:hypothetical protein